MEVLLEVVTQREVEERSPVRRQLHRRRQPSLHDREVARGEVAVQLVDVRADLEAVGLGERRRVDARPGDDDHAEARHALLGLGERRDHTAEQVDADARAAHRDDAHLLVGPVAELARRRCAVRELLRIEAGDVAGEVVVRLGPVADQRQVGAEGVDRRCRPRCR